MSETADFITQQQARNAVLRATVTVLCQYISPHELGLAADHLQTVQFDDEDPDAADTLDAADWRRLHAATLAERQRMVETLGQYRELYVLQV
ncbi:hypothetical protein [Candidatus Poriferisodalis sp.]|uniref:hypothetical protein n=1 Tax=Candidatus Poriferisodalis sp. TaxID=3101277 RepID=UPI003C6F3F76